MLAPVVHGIRVSLIHFYIMLFRFVDTKIVFSFIVIISKMYTEYPDAYAHAIVP